MNDGMYHSAPAISAVTLTLNVPSDVAVLLLCCHDILTGLGPGESAAIENHVDDLVASIANVVPDFVHHWVDNGWMKIEDTDKAMLALFVASADEEDDLLEPARAALAAAPEPEPA